MTEKLVIVGNGMAPGRMLEHLLDKAPGRYEVTIDRVGRAPLCAVARRQTSPGGGGTT